LPRWGASLPRSKSSRSICLRPSTCPGRRHNNRAERETHAGHSPGAAPQGHAVQRPHD
jgi:hypothetical protein